MLRIAVVLLSLLAALPVVAQTLAAGINVELPSLDPHF